MAQEELRELAERLENWLCWTLIVRLPFDADRYPKWMWVRAWTHAEPAILAGEGSAPTPEGERP